jgi:hypothetical protein
MDVVGAALRRPAVPELARTTLTISVVSFVSAAAAGRRGLRGGDIDAVGIACRGRLESARYRDA